MNSPRTTTPILDALRGLFYDTSEELGHFTEVPSGQLPPPADELLDHHWHMTVTMEAFHKSPVDVQVLDIRRNADRYSRKITLTRQSDGRVVQFGIVRLHLSFLDDEVRRQIEAEGTPLGRVLIEHGVLREVELSTLWRIEPGDEMRLLLGMPPGAITYGRTALIYCDGLPAVELLEVMAPVE